MLVGQSSNSIIFCVGGRQLHDCHALLIGVLTDKPKIIDEKELAWNYLYLEDDSGALCLLVILF